MARTALTGTRIREYRTLASIRQADLARAVGISAAYLNLIEHNRRRVSDQLLDALAGALGIAPKLLAEGGEGELFETLRAAAQARGEAAVAGPQPETDRIEEFVTRFPGWARLLGGRQARVLALERVVEDLSDRMAQDPHLSAAIHAVLSAVTSVRSTAAILAETEDIEPEWRERFHRNLAADSERLTEAAGAMVAYLDTIEVGDIGLSSPQEEMEAWLDRIGPGLPEEVTPEELDRMVTASPELATEAARQLARQYGQRAIADSAALPRAALAEALAQTGPDPGLIAARTGLPISLVMRRIASLPPEAGFPQAGLVISDGAGAFTFRRPVEGFALPRHGAACPLWPLYEAMRQPTVPLRRIVENAGRVPRRFVAFAVADIRSPEGFDGPQVVEATMLLLPADAARAAAGGVRPVGPSCRTCPRAACVARREPSILTEAI